MEKAYFLFLCSLLILGLFLPSCTAAGRAMVRKGETEVGHQGGNGGSKTGVTGSHSNTAPSKTDVSPPSKATGGQSSAHGGLRGNAAPCGPYTRNCK